MEQLTNTKDIVTNFIQKIWNENKFDALEELLHPDFKDHSLPSSFTANQEGLKSWVIATGKSFEHYTEIEEQVTEGDKSILKIRMNLKHVGVWRTLEPTGLQISTVGYRYFKIKDHKITDHWALLDGNALENQLQNTATGCKFQQ